MVPSNRFWLFLGLFTLFACIAAKSGLDAKRSNPFVASKCHQDECQLHSAHFGLYSIVKQSLESKFDIRGQDILTFLKATQVLRLRFNSAGSDIAGTELVQSLLSNESLRSALSVFQSDEGRELVNLYRAPVSEKRHNSACGQWAIQELIRAQSKMDSNRDFANTFAKIHARFARKSAKKCLKHSCNSIDASMSRLDSFLAAQNKSLRKETDELTSGEAPSTDREFRAQELELCNFFKRANNSDCQVSGSELRELSFLENDNEPGANGSLLDSYLHSYYVSRLNASSSSEVLVSQSSEAGGAILYQCRSISSLLSYNIAALKYYRSTGLLDEQRFESLTLSCPKLSYWLQLDRLCNELYTALPKSTTEDTFSYEVSSSVAP